MTETTITLPVTGMTCVGCAKSIETALNDREGVLASAVHLPTGAVEITYDAARIDPPQLVAAITATGFTVVEQHGHESLEDAVAIQQQRVHRRQWQRFAVGAVLTLPIFIISMGRDFGWLGSWAHAPWVNWLLLGLATPCAVLRGLALLHRGPAVAGLPRGQHGCAGQPRILGRLFF